MPEPSSLSIGKTSNSQLSDNIHSIILDTGIKYSKNSSSNFLNGTKYEIKSAASVTQFNSDITSKDRSFLRGKKFDVSSPWKIHIQKSTENLNDPVLLGYRQLNAVDSFSINKITKWNDYLNNSSPIIEKLNPICKESNKLETNPILEKKSERYLSESSVSAINKNINLLCIPQIDNDSYIPKNNKLVGDISTFKIPPVIWQDIHKYTNNSDLSSRQQSESPNMEDGKRNNSLWSINNVLKNRCTSGLHNLGNTCFMNSILQCLAHTSPLLDYCLSKNYEVDINYTTSTMKGSLIKAFANLVHHMWKNNESVSPRELKGQIQKFSPRFVGYNQHDAQEFLHFLLEGLHNDVNRIKIKPTPLEMDIDENLNDSDKAIESWKRYLRFDNSRIIDNFVGQLKNTLKCTVCNYTSVKFDPFWDLSLPIPKSCGRITLQDCLTLFTREETLDGEEKPTCSKCKTKRKCVKKLLVHKFPQILILHLKRFSQSGSFRDKLHTIVEYPLNGLDMIPYATHSGRGRANYNLYAVTHHSGSSFSGHYTASSCHPITHQWYRYNDESSVAITSNEVTLSEGYVLFYELGSQSSRL